MVKVLNDIDELGLKKDDVLFSVDNGQIYTFKDETFEDKEGVKINTSVTKSFSKAVLDPYKDNLQFEEEEKDNVKVVTKYVYVPVYDTYRSHMLLHRNPFSWLW